LPRFSIDTPPPTVSGSLHMGHVFSYTHQDCLARYQRMRGKNIFYPIGWDDNGLPTERRVQNFYNVHCDPSIPYDADISLKAGAQTGSSKPVSRQNFIELCLALTKSDEEVFKRLWTRLGLSVDWSLEYSTIDSQSRRISQRSFIELWRSGEAYQVDSPVYWDIGFGTAIAQAEMEDRLIHGEFYDIIFQSPENELKVNVATTRPELLPACVALAVHPEDERYAHLQGIEFESPLFHTRIPLIFDSKVQRDKGTGIVMICTFGDVMDVYWWRQHRLPLRQIIGPNGRMMVIRFGDPGWESARADAANDYYSHLQENTVELARRKIIPLLRNSGNLIKDAKPITHAVKFYEKGEKPLELLPRRQWYIRILDHKDELLEAGNQVRWHPEGMRSRYLDWVGGLNQDWCISRQRYFGVPFPVWYPLDSNGVPNYGKPLVADVACLPVDPSSDVPAGYNEADRGRPNGFVAELDVQDTWATSALTPEIALSKLGDPCLAEEMIPMDVRPQSHEIIRTWAFYTIAKSLLHRKKMPWRSVVISGWILDPDRKKMSKSKGNVVTPNLLFDQYSADAIRYWAAKARPGVDTVYDEKTLKVGKKLVTKLFNVARFLGRCLGDDSFDSDNQSVICPLDNSFLRGVIDLISAATSAFESNDWGTALAQIESFFWSEFCDDYIELIKSRAYGAAAPQRNSAISSLHLSFSILLRLVAPIVPFVAEEIWSQIYQRNFRGISIHRSTWPTSSELPASAMGAERDCFKNAQWLMSHIRRNKAALQVGMRWPVKTLLIRLPSEVIPKINDIMDDVAAAGTVEHFEVEASNDWSVDVIVAPRT